MAKVCVIGGGAAGMMAGIFLGRAGLSVEILERNEKLGKKVYITGKGRCNLTNACPPGELMQNVVRNPKFLYSALAGFSNEDTMAFFQEAGLTLKVERGERVFPVSDKASDVIRALTNSLAEAGVRIRLSTRVEKVLFGEGKKVRGVLLEGGEEISCDAVLVATGGLSYPSTGSTGDGYRFATDAGLIVTDKSPSLVPLLIRESYGKDLMGLSLKNVTLTIKRGKKVLFQDFGEMMFTDKGITGPLVLSASAKVGTDLLKAGELSGFIDLKPALSNEQLDARLLREFSANVNKQWKNVIGVLFPASLTPVIVALSGISPEKPVHEVTKGERLSLVELVKHFPLTITGLGSFNEAVVTRGGVKVGDINPATMEAKTAEGLYFAGEVLDVDAYTGGFNLQIAWSTGHLAAVAIAEKLLGKDDRR